MAKWCISRKNTNLRSSFDPFCPQELIEEDIDWWSKFYASLGDYDKCGDYIERGYDKIVVRPYNFL